LGRSFRAMAPVVPAAASAAGVARVARQRLDPSRYPWQRFSGADPLPARAEPPRWDRRRVTPGRTG
jgi:hypothetical protein